MPKRLEELKDQQTIFERITRGKSLAEAVKSVIVFLRDWLKGDTTLETTVSHAPPKPPAKPSSKI